MPPHPWSTTFFAFLILFAVPACQRSGGSGGKLELVSVEWGRRVRVLDVQGTLVRSAMVVGVDVQTTPQAYRLSTHPLSGDETLEILEPVGTPRFERLFAALDDNRGFVRPSAVSSTGPFTAVARNAALRIAFDRALDPASIDTSSVQVVVGFRPALALEYVWRIDPAEPEVLVLDPTVTPAESQAFGIAVSSLGFPEGVGDQIPNVELRFPTRADDRGQVLSVLRAATGARLKREREPVDAARRDDVVRVFRSGRASDPFLGFLPDLTAPRLLGTQSVVLATVSGDELRFAFDVRACEQTPEAGDRIHQGARVAEVTRLVQASSPEFVVEVRRLDADPTPFSTLEPASFVAPFDPGRDVPACFVEVRPTPAIAPTTGVSPEATFTLCFDEPLDPRYLGAFDAWRLTADPNPASGRFAELVVANVYPSADLRRVTFVPVGSGIAHRQGTAESLWLHVVSQMALGRGWTDLAGNAVRFETLTIPLELDPTAPTIRAAGFALRFSGADEDGDGRDDHQGQLVPETFDPPGPGGPIATGRLRGREVRRFSHQVDPTNPVIGIMWPLSGIVDVKAPLSEYGSRVMSVWRYLDLGFAYPLQILHNLDVEGIAFSPELPIHHDAFHRVRIRLTHAHYLPDEYIDLFSGQLPVYPNSGLNANVFESNHHDPMNHPPRVMYDGPFTVDPAAMFRAQGGTTEFLSWPAFRNAFGERVSFTWRDTNVVATGAPEGDGVDPRIVQTVLGNRTRYAGPSQVPSIGLPLLLDLQVWPARREDDTLGLNRFQTAIATTTSSRPTFRVFSEGGLDRFGNVVRVDPTDGTPRGGFHRDSRTGTPGTPTSPQDNVVYYGQVDFVLKVSRHVTRWFDTGATTAGFPLYHLPVLEPSPSRQPIGTSLLVEYRGAASVTANSLAATRGDCIDLYGRVMSTVLNANCTGSAGTVTDVTPWTTNLESLNGFRWLQIRWTAVANVATGAVPALDSTGIAYDPGG